MRHANADALWSMAEAFEMPSNVYKMQENAWRLELCLGSRWGRLQRSPRPLAGWEEVAAPPQEPHPALGLSGLGPLGAAP